MVGRRAGFTLIELLVVLSIIGLLLSLATPRYFQHVERAKVAVLRENLATLRDAIDQYRADKEAWPASLEVLARERYLRAVPPDPITGQADTWVTEAGEMGVGVRDVRSGAAGADADGNPYADW